MSRGGGQPPPARGTYRGVRLLGDALPWGRLRADRQEEGENEGKETERGREREREGERRMHTHI